MRAAAKPTSTQSGPIASVSVAKESSTSHGACFDDLSRACATADPC